MISGPSGVGKGTLRKALFDAVKGLEYSISCTTREPREGETEGVDYSFIGHERFRELVEQGSFLEWAEVHGNLYGTLKESIERILSEGRDAVLEIDVQGLSRSRIRCRRRFLSLFFPHRRRNSGTGWTGGVQRRRRTSKAD